ncbi:hypothetical protein ACTU3I_12845 [Microbacterium sp. RD1]|uniref:hypothetical protein n=1 Tax=Microbacterium sp. RD1 TaxID=3457313 RepID=UPI003FA5526D
MTIADNLVAPGDNDSASTGERLRMLQIGEEDWLIHDHAFPENDARHLVACVRARGLDHVDVIWLQGRGLPPRFPRVQDALEAAGRAVSARPSLSRTRAENWLG